MDEAIALCVVGKESSYCMPINQIQLKPYRYVNSVEINEWPYIAFHRRCAFLFIMTIITRFKKCIKLIQTIFELSTNICIGR